MYEESETHGTEHTIRIRISFLPIRLAKTLEIKFPISEECTTERGYERGGNGDENSVKMILCGSSERRRRGRRSTRFVERFLRMECAWRCDGAAGVLVGVIAHLEFHVDKIKWACTKGVSNWPASSRAELATRPLRARPTAVASAPWGVALLLTRCIFLPPSFNSWTF